MIPKEVLRVHAAYMVGGYDAGAQMNAFYPTAASVFPVLPREFQLAPDSPQASFGIAWYLGETADGRPIFSIRDDNVLSSKVAWHEAGHALERVLGKRRAEQFGGTLYTQIAALRSLYWLHRQFDGTWEDADAYAAQIGYTSGGWYFVPGESVAESISAAVGGYVQSEWTTTYGKDLAVRWWEPSRTYDPVGGGIRAREFWLERMREVDMDETQVRAIAAQAAQEAVERYAAAARDTGFEPIKDAFNDHKHDTFLPDGTKLDIKTGVPVVTLGNG